MSDLPWSCHWSLIAVLDAAFRNRDRELHSQKEDSIRSKRFIFFPRRMILHTQRLPITTALRVSLWFGVPMYSIPPVLPKRRCVPLCTQTKSITAKWPAPWPDSFSPCLWPAKSCTGQSAEWWLQVKFYIAEPVIFKDGFGVKLFITLP